MKKVNMEINYKELQGMAKELGLKFVGIKKDVLVAQVNEAIEALKVTEEPKKGGKWFEVEGAFPFTEGSLAIITNHKNKAILGRMVQISGPSTKRNALKCHMVNPKNGGLQNTHLSLDFDMVTLHIPQYPVVLP